MLVWKFKGSALKASSKEIVNTASEIAQNPQRDSWWSCTQTRRKATALVQDYSQPFVMNLKN